MIGGPLGRAGATAQNALEIARFGGLETGEGGSPYTVVSEASGFRLRHYFPAEPPGPAVLLIPPLMLDAEVYDVLGTCGVSALRQAGLDPWVVDFGRPEQVDAGLERGVEDHVLAVDGAINLVRQTTGRTVHVAGYSQGGMFAFQATALRRDDAVASIVAFGSAVDVRAAAPFGLSPDAMAAVAGAMARGPLAGTTVPAWASRLAFQVIDPAKTVRKRIDFIRRLHDREALLPSERSRRFLDQDGYVSWPGPAVADLMRDAILHNRMLQGGLVVDGRAVSLADLTVPILAVVGAVDNFTPPAAARGIARAAPTAPTFELEVPAGHFGLVVGSKAAERVWPAVVQWVRWHEDGGSAPRAVRRIDPDPRVVTTTDDAAGAGLLLGAGASAAKTVAGTVVAGVRGARGLLGAAQTSLPALGRLDAIDCDTRISMSLLFAEHADRRPDVPAVLFDDRAHTYAQADRRISNVAAGLLSVGVRQGERVALLMETRPSAFVLIAALNRIGAVAVFLRPDGDPTLELSLSGADRVVADPEHLDAARSLGAADVLALGGGGKDRHLGEGVRDMERIDPDAVVPPSWYTPDPGLARDEAFVLFAGVGAGTRVLPITNGRWALSAFGTASAAALGEGDTLYTATPLHHSSTLLMTVGGAVAAGARVALSSGYEPGRFWAEVRRYGVTVASYTWTMLRDVADAPPDPAERHHGVRLLIGSGMPAGLWERVAARFAPARIVEFYASAAGAAVLVNLDGAKPGSVGRPLPGAPAVRVVAWDLSQDRLVIGDDGLGRLAPPDEPGMLVTRTPPGGEGRPGVVRNVLERGDAWTVSGDLIRRDGDGDLWLVGPVAQLVRTAAGPVAGARAQGALGRLAQVDLAVAHPLPDREGDEMLAVALTLRDGARLAKRAVVDALADVPEAERPKVVHVREELPMSRTYRPNARALACPDEVGEIVLDRRGRAKTPAPA